MNKKLFFASLCLSFGIVCAQTNNLKTSGPTSLKDKRGSIENHSQDQGIIHCVTDEAMEDVFRKDPAARLRYEEAQKAMGSWENSAEKNYNYNSVFSPAPGPLDTIPIVFHILHQGGAENISNQQIYDALAQLNIDYKKLDADTTGIEPYFQDRATACNLVFQLATKDPLGNCTNGINRYYDSNTNWDRGTSTNNGLNNYTHTWDPRKYLNIYIVKSILTDGSSSGGTVIGYTYRPGTFTAGYAADAIVYNYQFLGAASKDVRSLAHEIGHWLNLAHTFGSTNNPGVNCGDDFLGTISGVSIDDTPKTLGAFSTCPNATPNTCDASNYTNVQNIMDYSSCPKMFTLGQCKRMRYTLTLTTSGRNILVSAANKIQTGIRNPLICSPVADFGANKRNICVGNLVSFADSTLNAQVTSYQWEFQGGTPATSTESNPFVTYNIPGVYSVSYTATNSAGSNAVSKNAYINVRSNVASLQGPYVENFENIYFPSYDWFIENTSSNVKWIQDTTVGSSGTNCIKIDNYNNSVSKEIVFYTPSYNISQIVSTNPGAVFNFKLAYQRRSTNSIEKLQVFSSINCGQTWTQRYSKTTQTTPIPLQTVSAINANPFIPLATDWRTESVSINALTTQTNVMFKFVFTSAAAGLTNNIYIDDINISNWPIGDKEFINEITNYSVFPNPSNGIFNLKFQINNRQNVILEITDIIGKLIYQDEKNLSSGEHNLLIGSDRKLMSGIYFCKLKINGIVYTKKIIID